MGRTTPLLCMTFSLTRGKFLMGVGHESTLRRKCDNVFNHRLEWID